MQAIGRFIRTALILAILVFGGAIAYALSGHYDVAVGSGHQPWTQWFLKTVRERSIARRTADIEVPGLDAEDQFISGAQAYDQGCAGCHGRPGREPSDRFDPRPPALTRRSPQPAETFWVIRNGIKMSAMPAIGQERLTDEQAWAVVAFLQGASRLTEGEYRQLVEPPPPAPQPEAENDPADEDISSEDPAAGAADDRSTAENATATEDEQPEIDDPDSGAGETA